LASADRWFSNFAAVLAVSIGAVALLGWQFDLPALRSVLPGLVAMNPTTAVGLVLAGLALGRIARAGASSTERKVAAAMAAVVAALGAIRLLGVVAGHDLEIDRVLFRGRLESDLGQMPNRMAPNTAWSLLVLGLGLLALHFEERGRGLWSQLLATVALLSSVNTILGYGFGVRAFARVNHTFIPMALNTAFAIFALALGILFARPNRGLAAIAAGRHAGAVMVRWFLPLATGVICVISWVVLRGVAAGWYPFDFAACLIASSCILAISAMAVVGAIAADRIEAGRLAAVEDLRRGRDELEVAVQTRTDELRRANRELEFEIEEHRRAQEEVRREREFSAQIIASSVDGIVAFDRDFRLTAWNPGMERISGLAAGQVLGRLASEAFPFIVQTGELAHMREALTGQTVTVRDRPFEIPETGRKGFFEGSLSPLRTETGEVIGGVAVIHDTTGRRLLEEQFRQAQKLEAVGRLAGGVAHDFNNILTAIMGHAQFLKMRIPPSERAAADVDEVLKAAARAAALTRQLLAFSRQQVLDPQGIDLNTVIADLEKMLRRLIGEDVDLVIQRAANLGLTTADRGQIEQVVMNLVVNARDAMPEGGRLTIETANVEIGQELTGGSIQLAPGRYVMLAVSDSGIGMTPEVRARAFEPFFTTKEVGQGTGLGLSTVHGIVTQSGGSIDIYSEAGHGTTFKIYLPLAESQSSTVSAQAEAAEPPRGGETILIVEDEIGVRHVVAHSLELLGYNVIEASDGTEAIAIAERSEQSVDLLITDVVMPAMNGTELAQRVASLRPGLRVLLMSGYADRALIHRGLREQNGSFLQKPFTPEALATKVREVLDRAA